MYYSETADERFILLSPLNYVICHATLNKDYHEILSFIRIQLILMYPIIDLTYTTEILWVRGPGSGLKALQVLYGGAFSHSILIRYFKNYITDTWHTTILNILAIFTH